jgi:D-alanyl-lipoteichoic acid acyltransferase DltB (MBOAT superfamily)
MSFNSTTFVFFFLFAFFVYWGISRWAGPRVLFLLMMSCLFYASWSAKFFLLLAATMLVDWGIGLALGRTDDPGKRKALLLASLVSNLGTLAFFKYFNFFAQNFITGLQHIGLGGTEAFVPWNIVLPVGISFYTFQSLTYTIDVYRRHLEPTRSLIKFCTFVTFFPQLVAGPIVRAAEFLPQLEVEPRYEDHRVQTGVFLMLCGLIKKVVLADTIGTELVVRVFRTPEQFSPAELVLGIWGALFQFYLDFSAYSDIAIGAAACLGFTLPLNFNRPFMAQTFGDFWRRWHITLSTFLRDYLFFPLGGTRVSMPIRFRNFMVTMLLAGLWHGAGWNYIIWGGMHGFLSWVSSERARRSAGFEQPTLWKRILRRAWIFNLVALSMLFFRNGTVAEGKRGVEGTLTMLRGLVDFTHPFTGTLGVGTLFLAIAMLIHFTPKEWVNSAERRWVALPSLVQALVLVLATGALAAVAYQQSPFIYFQF